MPSPKSLLDQAIALHQAGRLGEAEALYRQILQSQPHHPDALHLLGVAAHQQGKGALAQELIERAIRQKPSMAIFHNNLGEVLRAAGRFAEAAACYQQAIERDGAFAGAWGNLGLVLHQLDHQADARLCLERALQLQENFPDAWNNLGMVAQAQKRSGEAETYYQRAIEQQPGHGLALNNLANLKAEQKAFPEAIALYRRALDAAPGSAMTAMNLLHHRLNIADWDDSLEALVQQVRGAVEAGQDFGVSPFSFSTVAASAAEQRHCAEHWAASRLAPLAASAEASQRAPLPPSSDGRLRIGYLSPDFRLHPVSLLAVGLFERHDRRRFKVHGYSIGPDDGSAQRQRIAGRCEVFRDLTGMSALDAAGTIRGDGVDILIDLAGYTQGARPEILALHPAPVQVGYLGYLGTLGGGILDYLVSDKTLTPPGSEALYAEKLIRLPWYQINSRTPLPPAPSRREAGLPEEATVLCCFNQTMKIQPRVFAVWLDLLRQAPHAVLWLLADNPWGKENLLRHAASAGIGPERLFFAPRVAPEEYYARLQLADLFLDTMPYNAGTTAADALWAGVPVLTVQGETFAGRMAASVTNAFGLPGMVACSLEEYRARALDLLRDTGKLAALKAEIIARREHARLFDTLGFVRHFETALEQMAARQRQGLPPEDITLDG